MTEVVEQVVVKPRPSLARRIGCSVILVFWFALLTLPCFLIVLAVNQEIVIQQGELPGQQLRLWLIMEEEQRGIGISSTSIQQESSNALCMTTANTFVLWSGRAEPLSYCECFERADESSVWAYTGMSEGACSASR